VLDDSELSSLIEDDLGQELEALGVGEATGSDGALFERDLVDLSSDEKDGSEV
jgi:hypothetical protein